MTLHEQLEKAETQLFLAEMSDCIGGAKLISEARLKVYQLKQLIAEAGA